MMKYLYLATCLRLHLDSARSSKVDTSVLSSVQVDGLRGCLCKEHVSVLLQVGDFLRFLLPAKNVVG